MISLCLYFLCRPVSKKFFAGASADNTPAVGGALAFYVSGDPSWAHWHFGSAFMLVAGAGADSSSDWDGAFTFDMTVPPSWGYWTFGSAII